MTHKFGLSLPDVDVQSAVRWLWRARTVAPCVMYLGCNLIVSLNLSRLEKKKQIKENIYP